MQRLADEPKFAARRRMVAAVRQIHAAHPDWPIGLDMLNSYADSRNAPDGYAANMMDTKIALVPRGVTAETHRFHEAMRAGCVVIGEALPDFLVLPLGTGTPAAALAGAAGPAGRADRRTGPAADAARGLLPLVARGMQPRGAGRDGGRYSPGQGDRGRRQGPVGAAARAGRQPRSRVAVLFMLGSRRA